MEEKEITKFIEDRARSGIEYRALEVRATEPEDNTEEFRVEGFATTYDQPYVLWREKDYIVTEQVDRHAFDESEMNDVIMQYDHSGKVYARTTNGTLELNHDNAHGLEVRADLSKTPGARELYEEIKGGFISQMSMGFTVADDSVDDMGEIDGVQTYQRTIKKIGRLYDVSRVSIPANYYTEISARSGVLRRSVEQLESERLQAEIIRQQAEARAVKKQELTERLKALINKEETHGN